MKYLGLFGYTLYLSLLTTGCKSSTNKVPDQSEEPIFGIYYFKETSTVKIELREDSTAVMDIHHTTLQKNTGTPAVHHEGRFTYRNDSLFIDWNHGGKMSSRFGKKPGTYSFRIGATRYEKKIK